MKMGIETERRGLECRSLELKIHAFPLGLGAQLTASRLVVKKCRIMKNN
jgi:hypothetical protein